MSTGECHLNHTSAARDEFFSGIASDPDISKKTRRRLTSLPNHVSMSPLFSTGKIAMAGLAHKNIFSWWWWANISAGVCPS
jgi:hypothetical protein